MSLKKDIIANYAGVVITTVLTFLVVPFYLHWLGPDAYGLVGIATMVQGWVMILNAGLAPVAGRQAAQAHCGAVDWESTARFFRTIDWMMATVCLAVVILIFFLAPWLTTHWLKVNAINDSTVSIALFLLVITGLIRLVGSVSRGIVANLEEQVWLNVNLIIFSLLRFAVSLPLVYYWPYINTLFLWWIFIAFLEYASLQRKIHQLVPCETNFFVFDVAELKQHGGMAATLAFTSAVWLLITQLDKLVLTTILPLGEYGYYTIATLLASGVLVLSQPIVQAFQPRLISAYASKGSCGIASEIIKCTRWIVLLTFPVGAILFSAPDTIIYLWTSDVNVARFGKEVIRGYVLGNLLISVGGVLYYLQLALGNVKLHFRGNLIFAVIIVPLIPYVAKFYGAAGAAWSWAMVNCLIFVLWNSFVLWKFEKTLLKSWLWDETLFPLIALLIFTMCITSLINFAEFGRLFQLCFIVFIYCLATAFTYFLQRKFLFYFKAYQL